MKTRYRTRNQTRKRNPKKNPQNQSKNECDGNDIQCDLKVIDEITFSVKFKSDDELSARKWTLEEQLGTGKYGATFLARSNVDRVFVSKSVAAVKAQLPEDDPWPNQQEYDKQEYNNQHLLACRFNDKLKELQTLKKLQRKTYAMFPEVYFIGVYDSTPTSLTLFKNEGIEKSIVAGMEKLDCTLKKTLGDLLISGKHEEIAKLMNKAIVSVANTLQEVNKDPDMYFVHGDLHDGNIMHDNSQEKFYIIDFGAARITSTKIPQLSIKGNFFYNSSIAAGSFGLDLMALCLSLVEYIDSPSIQDDDMTEEKGLLSHLWYPLWNFFSSGPQGKEGFEVDDNIYQILNPTKAHFLGAGKLTIPDNMWPQVMDTSNTAGWEELSLSHFFGYTAGDESPKTLAFAPVNILSNDAINDMFFMHAMRNYFEFNGSKLMLDKLDSLLTDDDDGDDGFCKKNDCKEMCVVSYMPQFRTFTLNGR